MASPGWMGTREGETRPYRVRELNDEVARLLEARYAAITVEGEISGWKRHRPSGHCYFRLKDGDAELQCALYRSRAASLTFDPTDGMRVLAFGRLTIYSAKGSYQLTAERLVPAGAGELMVALQQLKTRLGREGLFDEARKRPLPRFPAVVGVVTSPAGAAIADIVRVLRSRWPSVEILLTPVKVQGEGAAEAIARGVYLQSRQGRSHVLIVGRGGGSIEDLWAFNDERVVRAIAESAIPVISAVGHETDVTLADLAADHRAATPSRGAEMAVPDARAVAREVGGLGVRLARSATHALRWRREELVHITRSHGLHRPRGAVEAAMQRADELAHRLDLGYRRTLGDRRVATGRLGRDLTSAALQCTRQWTESLSRASTKLEYRAASVGEGRRPRLAELGGKLDALSPLHVLARGYALCASEDGRLVRDGVELAAGDRVQLRFHRGGARGTIIESWPEPAPAAGEPKGSREGDESGAGIQPGVPTGSEETR